MLTVGTLYSQATMDVMYMCRPTTLGVSQWHLCVHIYLCVFHCGSVDRQDQRIEFTKLIVVIQGTICSHYPIVHAEYWQHVPENPAC